MSNVPRVVAIVVVHNPGTWFRETLESLRDSDYPNFSTVFVDTSTADGVSALISEILPQAQIIREEASCGFAAACNIGARHSEDATHLLFCHDDVAFAPDAIRRMVEEAFLMNAGIVAPKYVVWNSPEQILSLGADMDRTGTLATRIDVGDLDQGQYDVSQQVLVAPGGAILVRVDLFEAVRGFDEKMFLYYEDADFSWRSSLAGARIVVAPLAKVRHLAVSTLGARRARGARRKSDVQIRSRLPRHERIRYSRKNQVRALSANVNGFSRTVSILQYLIISVLEAAYFALTGKPKIALAILESWLTVFARHGSMKKKRKSILHYRVKSDRELRTQMIRGSARVKGYIHTRRHYRSQGEAAPSLSGWRDYSAEKSILERLTTPHTKTPKGLQGFEDYTPISIALGKITRILMWIMVAAALLGSRHLLVGEVPLYGQFLPFGTDHQLLSTYFSGPLHHHGPVSPSPTSELILGGLGYLFLGGTGLEAHFVYGALIVMGMAGVFRIVADYRNRTAAYVSVVLYAVGPILGGVISAASLSGLVIYGLAPWLLLRLFRLADLPGTYRSSSLSTRYEVAVEGLWLALIIAFAPSFLFVFAALVIVLAVTGPSLKYLKSFKKLIFSQLAALIVALILNSPWIFSYLQSAVASSSFFGSATPSHLSLPSLLLFQISPAQKVPLLFGLYLVALVGSLFFVRGRRADRVFSLLTIFALLMVAAVFSAYGAFGENPIPLWIILPVAFLIAVVVIGSGIEAAFAVLPKMKISFNHFVVVLVSISVLVSSYVMLGDNLSGRFNLVSRGYGHSLSWMYPSSKSNPGKALWLGRPGTLPVGSYQISGAMAVGISEIGTPTVDSLFPPAAPGRVSSVINAINAATREDTVYLGRRLAQLRIKYVVIPQSSLNNQSFLTSDLNLMLSRQRDLNQLVADPSVVAFSVQDPLSVPIPEQLSRTASLLNELRFWLEILVAVIWVGLIEATLSRRSIALWIVRKFMSTLIGRAFTRLYLIFRPDFTPKAKKKSAKVQTVSESKEAVVTGDSPPGEFEFKHVKIAVRQNAAESDSPTLTGGVSDGEG